MNPISKLRFDALAGYSRSPTTALVAEELSYFEEADERVLGMIVRDREDDNFATYVLGRDRTGRFRMVDLTVSLRTATLAEEELRRELEDWAARPAAEYYQGDESGRAIRLLPVRRSRRTVPPPSLRSDNSRAIPLHEKSSPP